MCFCLIPVHISAPISSPLISASTSHPTATCKQISEGTASLGASAECTQPNDDLEKVKRRPRAFLWLLFPRWPCGRSCVIRNLINRWMYCNASPRAGVVAVATTPQELQVNDGKNMIFASWNLSTFNTTNAKWTLTAIWVVWFLHTSETFKQADDLFSSESFVYIIFAQIQYYIQI